MVMKMEKICKKCNHWQRNNVKWGKRGFGDCHCEKFKYDPEVEAVTPTDCLTYTDAESCDAYFKTGENFGCIHFKPTDEMTYDQLYKLFCKRNEQLIPYIQDYRPAGNYKLQIWFKNHMSIVVAYKLDTDRFEIEAPKGLDGEKE